MNYMSSTNDERSIEKMTYPHLDFSRRLAENISASAREVWPEIVRLRNENRHFLAEKKEYEWFETVYKMCHGVVSGINGELDRLMELKIRKMMLSTETITVSKKAQPPLGG